jgi:hypothetical protein
MESTDFWKSLGNGIINTAVRGALMFAALTFFPGAVGVVAALGVNVGMEIYNGVRASRKEKNELLDQFRNEIAASSGKSPETVTIQDLNRERENNPVFRQSINESGARRLSSWMGLAIGLFAVCMIGALVPIIPGAGGAGISFFEWAFEASKGAKDLIGINFGASLIAGMALSATRWMVKPLVTALVGGNIKTVAEYVDELETQLGKGLALQPEQVMEVAVAANPTLRRNIVREWGKDYEAMSFDEKCVVLANYPAREQVDRLTQAVNNGNVAPPEIAYAVMGKSSGVAWDHYPKGPKVREKKFDFGKWVEQLPELLTEGPDLSTIGTVAQGARDAQRHYSQRRQISPVAAEMAEQVPAQPRRSFVAALEAERAARGPAVLGA